MWKHWWKCSFSHCTLPLKQAENNGLGAICHTGCRQLRVASKMFLSLLQAPTAHKSNSPALRTRSDLSPSSTWQAEMLLASSLPADDRSFHPPSLVILVCNWENYTSFLPWCKLMQLPWSRRGCARLYQPRAWLGASAWHELAESCVQTRLVTMYVIALLFRI